MPAAGRFCGGRTVVEHELTEQPSLEHAVLEGERVLLRPLARRDAAAAFPLIHRRREVLDWLIWQGPRRLAELEDAYDHWISSGETGCGYHFAVVDRAEQAFCGTIGVRFTDHPFVGDLGYWIGSAHWGRGLATEAVALTAYLCFEHLRARRLVAEVFLGNEASRRVLDKNGFACDPTTHRRRFSGRLPDVDRERWRYTLTAEAWRCSEPAVPEHTVRLAPARP